MNKSIEPDQSPRDNDIGALLRAQKISAPTDLDDFILAEARLAVSDPAQGSATRVSSGVRTWLAAAAVAMIAVGVAPMLLQSPESELILPAEPQLDEIAPNTRAVARESAESVRSITAEAESNFSASEQRESDITAVSNQTAPVVATKRSTNTALSGGAAGDIVQEAPPVSQREDQSVSGTASLVKATRPANSLSPPAINESAEYRLKPETWIKEMQRLEARHQTTTARFEYTQFRRRFPDYETPYRPK